jgi:hypothetical protein
MTAFRHAAIAAVAQLHCKMQELNTETHIGVHP